MLRIYYSNRLERLALAQASVLERPLSDPLLPERIVTQSPGTANWLAQRLAERLGVVANVDFALPASFVWEVYAQQLPQVPPRALLDRQTLVWAVFDRLHALPGDPAFAEPADYLRGDNRELRTYQLACRIADLLDQYQVYRPDWILAWERGEEAHWQARLWRLLTEGAAPRHRARLWDELRTLSEASGLDPARLPQRVSVFGISALAPVHLDVLERIARLTEVHLFTVNPSLAWWGDITSARDLARLRARWRAQRRPDASEYYEAGHPLLASMGHQGRELFDQLQGLQAEELELFEEPEADTLLAGLQRDLLILTDRSRADQDPSEVRPGDLSVQVHACHSPLREVQVLHDRLLDLFERLPGLEPRDLAVMAPDIDVYAPYVEAVFGAAPAGRHIPWSIADRSRQGSDPLVRVLIALLGLPASRLKASEVLGLLEVPAVMRRFGLDAEAVERLRGWVRDSGARWGLDGMDRDALGLQADDSHSWAFGLRRLLLGYALPPERRLFRGVLPLAGVEGTQGEDVGVLAEFLSRLGLWRERLSAARRPAEWQETVNRLLDDFLHPDEDQAYLLQELRDLVGELVAQTGAAGLDRPLPLELVRDHLCGALQAPGGGSRFLAGQVSFCNMVPLRSIPFRVLCLIGMNDGAYPRARRPCGLDLMAASPRPGDRSRRLDDRYLFLEAILSARDVLYISYLGRSARDNAPLLPSPLVEELLEHLEASAGAAGSGLRPRLVVEHPLQPFSLRYFQGGDRLFSYEGSWLEGARAAAAGPAAPVPFVPGPLPEPEPQPSIDIERLVRFFRHPCRYFCTERLGLRLEERDQNLEDAEPFSLDALQSYQLGQQLLEDALAGISDTEGLAIAAAAGALPPGAPGVLEYRGLSRRASALSGRLAPLLAGEPLSLELDLQLDAGRITGWLRPRAAGGLVRYRSSTLKAEDRLRLWIEHLALCAAGAPAESVHLAQDLSWRLRPVGAAAAELSRLLGLYRRGLCEPLRFFPRTSWAWASTFAARGDPQRALAEAAKVWAGDPFRGVPGEGEGPYTQLAFRGRDALGGEMGDIAGTVYAMMIACSSEEPA